MINCSYYTWINEVEPLEKINKIIEKKSIVPNEDSLKAKNSTKTSKIKYIDYIYLEQLIHKYVIKALSVNSDYFGYSLFPLSPTKILNVNYYNVNEKYEWHCDFSKNPVNDIKLTLLINLSEKEYQGGEFEIFISEKPEKIKSFSKGGDMILLNSNVLHRVNPVTKGIRKSLSIFLDGPKFI